MTAWHDSMTNNHKQWLLSIDMKTKVVQHVPVINISTWYMTAWQTIINSKVARITFQHFNNISWFPAVVILTFFYLDTFGLPKSLLKNFTFPHMVGKKFQLFASCSACPSDQHKHLTYDSMTNNHKQWLLSIDMKTKVVQHVLVINISTWHMTAWEHDMTAWLHDMTAWQTIIKSDFWA